MQKFWKLAQCISVQYILIWNANFWPGDVIFTFFLGWCEADKKNIEFFTPAKKLFGKTTHIQICQKCYPEGGGEA